MIAISIASSGLFAASARLTISASNVANSETKGAIPQTPGSRPVQPTTASDAPSAYQPQRVTQTALPAGGVTIQTNSLLPSNTAEHDPSAPYANEQGMVAAPNVDFVSERLEQILAQRAYAANLSVVRSAEKMQRSLFDITV
jgi:flagellar basal-body rod protein FlgC